MRNSYKNEKQQRGAALLLVLAVFSIIIPLVQGVWLDSQLEYQFRRYRINELQARQNAKAGIGLSLLRIYIFKGVEKSVAGKWDKILRPIVDQIWSFPFSWPLPVSEDMFESDKKTLQDLKKQSFMKGAYATSLVPEEGFLDVNDLSSTFEPLRKFSFDSLLRLLFLFRTEKPEFNDRYQESDYLNLINNLSDWTDLDNQSQNGGSEELLEEGKKPLNRSFASIEEVFKVPGMDKTLFEYLAPHLTVYGSKALNINYASRKVLQAALGISEDLADQILYRTQRDSENYQPFLNQKDFCDFMNDQGSSLCETFNNEYKSLDQLRFAYPMAFRIKSSGEYRGQIVNMEALLYDLSASALNWQESLYKERKRQEEEEEGAFSGRNEERPQKAKAPKLDYSYYKSLIIMYLKESF